VNKKLELDMSEFLIAAEADNFERMKRILWRLNNDQKERLARGLVKALGAAFITLSPETVLEIQREYGFEFVAVQQAKEEIS
jgi:hypothetical protein